MSRPFTTILCEDQQQQTFIYRFLKRRGWKKDNFRLIAVPAGKADGKQHVREKYPFELRALRTATKHTALVVMTDGNGDGIQKRMNQLDNACDKENIGRRKSDDKVVVLIPTRNIETWLAYLGGESVDETQPYLQFKKEGKYKRHVTALIQMCNANELRPPAPPSLQAACEEYAKLR